MITLPAYQTEDEAAAFCEPRWTISRVEDCYEKLPTGRIWERKELSESGAVPVLDQSPSGIHGFHDGEPGVAATDQFPVATFANHTCAMRLVTHPFSVIQNVFPLRGLPGKTDTRFLYYWLNGRVHLEEYKGHFPDLRRLWLPLPSLAEQRAIAGVLGALDDKIESNRRSGSLIESIVPLLFRKFCGAAPADLFLSDIADFQKGVSYRSVDLQDSSAAMVTLKSFDRNGGYKSEGLKPYVGKFKDSQVIGIGEFAVAQTDLTQGAEVVGRVVRIPRDSRFETLIASLDLIIVRPRSTINATYLYGVLLDPRFREHCRARTSGTTVLHLGSDALPNYPIPAAGEADQLAFAKAAEPLLKRQDQLDRESASLAKVRDSLLPELLSGRIRVRDAESIVEDAL